jgi:predicted metal-dependent hydrolase
MNECEGPLHPAALEGIRLFNAGEFFEAHEELETAWRAETGSIRSLYQGILQVAVSYLHITRDNYDGAIKVYGRAVKWLRAYPDSCRGVDVAQLKRDAEAVFTEVERLGPERLPTFDRSLFKPISWTRD